MKVKAVKSIPDVHNLCESLRDGIVAGQFCGMKVHRRGTAVYLAKR